MSFTSICGVFMRYKTSCYKRQYSKSMNSQTDHRTRSMFTQRYICSGLKTQILTVSFFAILIITYWFAISFKETTKLLFYDLSRLLLYRIQIVVIFLVVLSLNLLKMNYVGYSILSFYKEYAIFGFISPIISNTSLLQFRTNIILTLRVARTWPYNETLWTKSILEKRFVTIMFRYVKS